MGTAVDTQPVMKIHTSTMGTAAMQWTGLMIAMATTVMTRIPQTLPHIFIITVLVTDQARMCKGTTTAIGTMIVRGQSMVRDNSTHQ